MSHDTEERRRRQWICEGCERTQQQKQRDGEYQFIAKGCLGCQGLPGKAAKPNLTAVNIDQLPELIDVYAVHLHSYFCLHCRSSTRVKTIICIVLVEAYDNVKNTCWN